MAGAIDLCDFKDKLKQGLARLRAMMVARTFSFSSRARGTPMKHAIALIAILALGPLPAAAQTAKELRTKKGTSVALVNLVNARPGCGSTPAPVAVPLVRE